MNQPPPHNIDVECAVLSACLLDSDLFDELQDVISAEDFYSEANRCLWDTATSLLKQQRPVDALTLANELKNSGKLERIGGVPYIAEIIDATPAIANVLDHAAVLSDLAQRRRVIDVARRIASEGYGDIGEPSEWFSKVEAEIFAATIRRNKIEYSLLRDLVRQQVEVLDAKTHGGDVFEFATIEWDNLRRIMAGGWRKGKLHVLAGRPGMGKTAGALRCAAAAAKSNEGVIVISLEMTKEELTQRLLASEASVPLAAIMSGTLSDADWASVTAAAVNLGNWAMSLEYCPGAKITRIRSIIRREMARVEREFGYKISLVVVDYLQLVNGDRRRGDSRESEVSDICRAFTALAGELDVAMLLLSQLNRELEKRPDKRPQLSDLRESGAIEQDAYSVSFMYRDEYYHENTADRGIVEWIIGKHRNGSLGTVRMRWDGRCVRIDEFTDEYADLDCWG